MTMKLYRKKGTTPMEPWTPEADMTRVSVSDEDKEAGSPKQGDMIAWDQENPSDRWLVSSEYFAKHYEEA